MRIIAGKHRSRPILGPVDQTTRPIVDRVKEALFNRLTQVIDFDGIVVLDVFCGTGSMGLEALSRGARHVTFLDRDRQARRLLAENLETLGETDRATVVSDDALATTWLDWLEHRPVDLALIDPPYAMMHDSETAAGIVGLMGRISELASADAMLMLRTETEVVGPTVTGFGAARSHEYGSMTLHLYERSD
ncbi:MAG: 16S rRNA (guanine(966)-N(2))-methyltransferase RsmD [Planctomycetaceae bacterium]|nr:16S rRNA (guanine(966)-N(2))-methyltransferase RsmD [Planctomycetaceae bacterium]